MAGKNSAFRALSMKLSEESGGMTLENASSMTIYQLRRELTRRGIFDSIFGPNGEKRHINFEACLQVLIAELVKEKEEMEWKRAQELEAARVPNGESLSQKLANEKEARKQAALERSARRQAGENYFEARKASNKLATDRIGTKSTSLNGPMDIEERHSSTSKGDGPIPENKSNLLF
jgi:hypothetical protein